MLGARGHAPVAAVAPRRVHAHPGARRARCDPNIVQTVCEQQVIRVQGAPAASSQQPGGFASASRAPRVPVAPSTLGPALVSTVTSLSSSVPTGQRDFDLADALDEPGEWPQGGPGSPAALVGGAVRCGKALRTPVTPQPRGHQAAWD